MLSTYLASLHEGFAKRTALVLLGLAALLAFVFNRMNRIDPANFAPNPVGQAEMAKAVAQAIAAQLLAASGVWLLIAVFAAAPMFSATLEKGWVELILSKGTRRWQIFMARLFAGVTMYIVTFIVAAFPLAIRLWWITNVPTWPIVIALLLETLAFAALLCVAALSSLAQKGAALPIMTAVVVWMVSPVLQERKQTLYHLLKSDFSHSVIDWIYRIMPKGNELHLMSMAYLRTPQVKEWWPVWSTGVFVVATLSLAMWRLERKSF